MARNFGCWRCSPARLPGALSQVPTATEQATPLVWPTVRGVYMAMGTPPALVSAWTAAFAQAHADPGYAALCQMHGLTPPADRCRPGGLRASPCGGIPPARAGAGLAALETGTA